MVSLPDCFDPTTWDQDEHEFRIYADDYANDYAVVDQIDYAYLIRWRWKLKQSRISKGTKQPKIYLARSSAEIIGEDIYIDGKRYQQRYTRTIYLHTEVIERSGTIKPKTNKRLIVDHADGDGLNCRRSNLRYATQSFNSKNLFGCLEKALV